MDDARASETGDTTDVEDSLDNVGSYSTNENHTDPFYLGPPRSFDDLLKGSADMDWHEATHDQYPAWSGERLLSSTTASSPLKLAAQDDVNWSDGLLYSASFDWAEMRPEFITPDQTDLDPSTDISGLSAPKENQPLGAPSSSFPSSCKDCGEKLSTEADIYMSVARAARKH